MEQLLPDQGCKIFCEF